METAMKAIGFSNLKTNESWEELKSDVLLEGSSSFIREYEDGRLIVEAYKKYADNVYLLLRSGLTEEDYNGMIHSVDECEPYVEAKQVLDVKDLEIESISVDEFKYHVICEDVGTGMTIIFRLQNLIEYFDCLEDNMLDYSGVNIVGIAIEGTIVLPVEVNEQEAEHQNEKREYLRVMLQKAKAGDEKASDLLKKEEEQLGQQFKEGLYKKDLLTLMTSYFVPLAGEETIYAVLGLIKELEVRQNKMTREKMYWMSIDVNGMLLEVIINTKDLVGKPYIGMRFMGTCQVQGTIEFE